jgi:hypothetical protein
LKAGLLKDGGVNNTMESAREHEQLWTPRKSESAGLKTPRRVGTTWVLERDCHIHGKTMNKNKSNSMLHVY